MSKLLFSVPLSEQLPDLEALFQTPVPGNDSHPMIGRRRTLPEHLSALQIEFAGGRQLYFFHAVLNVLIRREVDRSRAYSQFVDLWKERRRNLLEGLSARWLVSACDTIMDCAPEPYERAMACAASTFLNTVKLYESERRSYGPQQTPLVALSSPVPLFDGMTSFAVGKGDMIFNLRQRTKAVCQSSKESLAGDILLEILRRADAADTVYRRLAAVHTNEETRWSPAEV